MNLSFMRRRTLFAFSVCAFAMFSAVGCESSNTSGPPANEIEQYLENNPEHLADPNDSMVDESAEFEAGRVD
ncbi:hypothetical protein LOC71_14800 [Rhodopirellula sp. JC740]|uniref:Secreted protein n=1 Tax=Rhodopirellula halodulae TaxID=2894198 RepID=A0ABS8NJ39_9BACT|nr:hypothetical protein [Rhodopirellula sp. JC740]MCC9643551.1 hypothetical protein [Rhodopirellula sp. JC740]